MILGHFEKLPTKKKLFKTTTQWKMTLGIKRRHGNPHPRDIDTETDQWRRYHQWTELSLEENFKKFDHLIPRCETWLIFLKLSQKRLLGKEQLEIYISSIPYRTIPMSSMELNNPLCNTNDKIISVRQLRYYSAWLWIYKQETEPW